jgi:ABC-type bacteriocin/lantibiotic exporter with double-glycine peptidase domain
VNKQITLGQFVASEIIIITVLAAVEKIVGGLDTIYDLLTAVEKIGTVTDIENERTGGVRLSETKNGLHLKISKLNYTFPGKTNPSLSNITLEIKPGEKIGLTGSDGSGKTTLLRVLVGLLSDYTGSISYDNISLRKVDPDQLRLEIGDVQGMTDIFDGTLKENLTLGRPGITTEDLIHAMDHVGLREFLSDLPEGLLTHFQANDAMLSSGVSKRIVLARNIIGPPRMLIFNDFFVNLPADFRFHLRDTLFDSSHKWTVLASTQDAVFLEHCDRIIHLENGSIEAIGTYAELCQNPSFRRTVSSGFTHLES